MGLSLLIAEDCLPPLSSPSCPRLIFAWLSLGSWHSMPDPCQIPEKRQMGPAFYVLIKGEFAPLQTRHL